MALRFSRWDNKLLEAVSEPSAKAETERLRVEALAFQKAVDEWLPEYASAIELPSTRIFVALKEGRLAAFGRQLPRRDKEEALATLEREGISVADIPPLQIPPAFWSLRGINWEASSASNGRDHYCHVTLETRAMLAEFPLQERRPVSGVEQVGEIFVIDEALTERRHSSRPRGRPPLPWDAFHLEVADLLSRGELPSKKEAAIRHLQVWFERTLGQTPSRAAIGGKLKPYYDRFVRPADTK